VVARPELPVSTKCLEVPVGCLKQLTFTAVFLLKSFVMECFAFLDLSSDLPDLYQHFTEFTALEAGMGWLGSELFHTLRLRGLCKVYP